MSEAFFICIAPALCALFTHHEVELLCLLLVGPPLSNAGFAEVRLRHSRLDWLSGSTVVEALGYVVVFNGYHVLDGGQSGLWCFLDLEIEEKGGEMKKWTVWQRNVLQVISLTANNLFSTWYKDLSHGHTMQLAALLIILNGLKDPKSKGSDHIFLSHFFFWWIPGVTATKTKTTVAYELFL